MFIKFIFLISVFSQVYAQEELVDYYEKLIKSEIKKSSEYRFPKDASEYKPRNVHSKDFGQVDFVVIGAGSAGAVVASRLSEISEWNVLLLEAGKDETNFTKIPSMVNYVENSEYNWGFNSTPQKTCCLMYKGVCPFPRGKSLGGTSAINWLIYSRGNKADYDKWAEDGNTGWAYKDVLPYFIKSEQSHIDGDKEYHGLNGSLNINYPNPIDMKTRVFLEANEELGVRILDYNGKDQSGASLTQYNTVKGKRDSSNRAFLKRAQGRKNLQILTESYVTKILICNETNRAYGVIFSHKNVKYTVAVRKEVILSAGVVGSPQILMLSGIGPKKHLIKHGINVIKDLSVGENLHNQPSFFNNLFLTTHVSPFPNLRESIKHYLNGTGPLTLVSGIEALAFYQLQLHKSSAPDFEVLMIPSVLPIISDLEPFHINRISDLIVVLLHPKSRGKIYLKSNNPFEYPIIESSCLDDPENEDIEKLYEGVKVILKLLKTDAFKKLNSALIPFPPCVAHHPMSSKEYWMCNIRQTVKNLNHGAGTCKMGSDPAKGAVVDHRLRVYGIKNLRIADASIIPAPVSGHTNAPTMMIGERLADFIKDENNCK